MAIIRPDVQGFSIGTETADTVYGDGRENFLAGLGGSDTLWGRGGADLIDGGRGNDRLYGEGGDDFLGGAWGRDILTGGSGKDTFMFDVRPVRTEIDVITDYSPTYDTIWLYKDVFKSAGPSNKTITAAAFWKGSKAHDANDRIIYNDKTGALYYDPDGTGAKAQVQFAKIKAGLKMTYKDFFVFDA